MSLRDSSYTTLVRLKARYNLQKNSRELLERLENKFLKSKGKFEKLRLIYGYVPKTHESLHQPNKAPTSVGCGCEYCKALHNHAKLKMERHYFKATFYKDSNIRYSDPDAYKGIPVNFDTEYDSYCRECDKTKTVPISEEYFYEKRMAGYSSKIKKSRSKYRAIRDAIDEILSC